MTMPLPPNLPKLIELGANFLKSDRVGDLPLGIRQAIWAEMGPHRSVHGQRRRAKLAIAAARQVECYWAEERDDDFVERVLQAAAEAADGRVAPDVARAAASDAWTIVIEIDASERALGAAYAAVMALSAASSDEFFDPNDIDLERCDEIDPESRDASAFAAVAAAGGDVHSDDSDPDARRDFWRWWLTEAVPAAFEGD